ncbi:MAG: aminotransferase class I/II-fold pyridoxal phosphate-dependent enzyme [Candidatus Kapaibacterium sp.]
METTFFNQIVQSIGSRVYQSQQGNKFSLDKNEQPKDVELSLKVKIVESLLNANWNRYPSSDYKDIEANIAEYAGVSPENIVLSAGSASIITTLLDYFALNKKRIIITQPSYSLFDYHCKTYNIPYTPWLLNNALEYDLSLLPDLDANSVVIITAPNNPVGNSIKYSDVVTLLRNNPNALFIIDGVYTEFSSTDFTPLINEFNNLIVLRSFSKAFPIAGLRLGYLCATQSVAAIVKKLILQFSINNFSLIFAREILFTADFLKASKQKVNEIISERERMKNILHNHYSQSTITVFPSEGNFLLIRICNNNNFLKVTEALIQRGIKVLNTSNFILLENTIRISVGTAEENDAFLECMLNTM